MKRFHGISLVIGLVTGIVISVGVGTYMARKPVAPVRVPIIPQAPASAPVAASPATPSKPQPRTKVSARQLALKSTQNVGSKPV
jgi:hypothetical protein